MNHLINNKELNNMVDNIINDPAFNKYNSFKKHLKKEITIYIDTFTFENNIENKLIKENCFNHIDNITDKELQDIFDINNNKIDDIFGKMEKFYESITYFIDDMDECYNFNIFWYNIKGKIFNDTNDKLINDIFINEVKQLNINIINKKISLNIDDDFLKNINEDMIKKSPILINKILFKRNE